MNDHELEACQRDANQGRGPDCPDHPRPTSNRIADCLLAIAIGIALFLVLADGLRVL